MNRIVINDFSIDIYKKDVLSPCFIVVPGGGYLQLTENEGKPVAEKLNKYGFSAIVFNYSIRCPYPKPLEQFDQMMHYLQNHDIPINTHKLIGIGFSAGANLLVNYISLKSPPASFVSLCLCYGMLDVTRLNTNSKQLQQFYQTMIRTMTQQEKPSFIQLKELSPIYHIASLPTFLWHTANDSLISCKQSIEYSMKLKENNIPFALHIFDKGDHGLSLADASTAKKEEYNKPNVAIWFDMMITFVSKYINAK